MLKIQCSPITWPIGMGSTLKGVYHLLQDRIYLYDKVGARERRRRQSNHRRTRIPTRQRRSTRRRWRTSFAKRSNWSKALARSLIRIDEVSGGEAIARILRFGASANFGVKELLDEFVSARADAVAARNASNARSSPIEGQAHRICVQDSGEHGSRSPRPDCVHADLLWRIPQRDSPVLHVRSGKELKIPDAITFMAADRQHADTAYAGDIIGCTITARSTSATALAKVSSFVSREYRISHRRSFVALC